MLLRHDSTNASQRLRSCSTQSSARLGGNAHSTTLKTRNVADAPRPPNRSRSPAVPITAPTLARTTIPAHPTATIRRPDQSSLKMFFRHRRRLPSDRGMRPPAGCSLASPGSARRRCRSGSRRRAISRNSHRGSASPSTGICGCRRSSGEVPQVLESHHAPLDPPPARDKSPASSANTDLDAEDETGLLSGHGLSFSGSSHGSGCSCGRMESLIAPGSAGNRSATTAQGRGNGPHRAGGALRGRGRMNGVRFRCGRTARCSTRMLSPVR